MNNYAILMHNYKKLKIAVVGGSGYSGQELQRILKRHPAVGLNGIFNSQTAKDLNPSDFDTVFLATPAEVSAELAPKIFKAGTSVIDLSGAFRLNTTDIQASYEQWYGMNHPAAQLVASAHYGLVPWTKPSGQGPFFISNPGCYATAILMGLLPLLKLSVIDATTLVIDAKSGTTGAGKKASESQLFSEVDGECLPYKVGVHQHLPEINLFAKTLGQTEMDPFFTTSLLPTRRGIVAGMYAKLSAGKTVKDVKAAMNEFYGNYPLVQITETANLKKVVGSAQTHISFKVVGEKLYLFSCIDNLLKGAASQAVENFNLMNNLPVTTGMDHLEAII